MMDQPDYRKLIPPTKRDNLLQSLKRKIVPIGQRNATSKAS